MRYFLILLISKTLLILLISNTVIARDIYIVASVNQTPITNVDIQNSIDLLRIFSPDFKKYSNEQQQSLALRNEIQILLKEEYIKRTNFSLSREEKKQYASEIIEKLKNNVENPAEFTKKYENFINSEVMWRGVVEKVIKPSMNVSNDATQDPSIIEQYVQSQTLNILESLRKSSVIEMHNAS